MTAMPWHDARKRANPLGHMTELSPSQNRHDSYRDTVAILLAKVGRHDVVMTMATM
jgi:hypothetical protein